ncbi:hypothetical protein [Streptomyces sp. NPDC015242]|uniref:hypothetical protein n=1 Tax=Streptomyces sp. NPDC015242 TaxID=3364951 RepID=UPI0036F94D45
MAAPTTGSEDTPPPARVRERPSRLVDISVALLLLVADAVIVVVDVLLFVMVGMGRAPSPHSPPTASARDVPVVTWLVVWGLPALAATGAVVHARLRMPFTAVTQGLFTLACVLLAVVWTRMLLA